MTPPAHAKPMLEVTGLSVSALAAPGRKELVHEASFCVFRGEVLVILGESGSGKTSLIRSLTRLFPATSFIKIKGSVTFEGLQLQELDETELRLVRRNRIRNVFQDPTQALNPLATIRQQLRLAYDGHRRDDRILIESLVEVGLSNATEVLEQYPHQLSVGMAQRICIAMAVLPSPALLIADEPTSAVDASLRYKLLELLNSVRRTSGMAMLLVTHDLDVAREYGDRVIVMYDGRIIESAPREEFFERALHPYSRLLLGAFGQGGRSPIAPGSFAKPEATDVAGCRFLRRCPLAQARCSESEPELEQLPTAREVRCLYWR